MLDLTANYKFQFLNFVLTLQQVFGPHLPCYPACRVAIHRHLVHWNTGFDDRFRLCSGQVNQQWRLEIELTEPWEIFS